jgi:hypothetical protein
MKILIGKTNIQKKKSIVNFEKILIGMFTVAFLLTVIIQTALLNSDFRTIFSVDSGLEGTPLGQEEYLYMEGIVVLKLLNQETCPALKVLVNGDEVDRFFENESVITVKDGDVIEVDGSQVSDSLEVGIKSTSSNISLDSIYREFKVDSSIQKLTRVRIK